MLPNFIEDEPGVAILSWESNLKAGQVETILEGHIIPQIFKLLGGEEIANQFDVPALAIKAIRNSIAISSTVPTPSLKGFLEYHKDSSAKVPIQRGVFKTMGSISGIANATFVLFRKDDEDNNYPRVIIQFSGKLNCSKGEIVIPEENPYTCSFTLDKGKTFTSPKHSELDVETKRNPVVKDTGAPIVGGATLHTKGNFRES